MPTTTKHFKKKVREAYIYAKYLHHAFFKNEAGGPPVPEERFPVGKAVEYEAMTTKLSGGKMFGGNKWDKRSLRLANSDLAYLDGGKEKGRFSVLGAAVELVSGSLLTFIGTKSD